MIEKKKYSNKLFYLFERNKVIFYEIWKNILYLGKYIYDYTLLANQIARRQYTIAC